MDLPPNLRSLIPGGPNFPSNDIGIQLHLENIQHRAEASAHVSYHQLLAEVLIHELVHVRLFMIEDHPDLSEADGSHPIGDAIYREAWAWYESTFGVPAVGSGKYNPAEHRRRLPRCLRG